MGRAYSCWMLNWRCITWPVGCKRLRHNLANQTRFSILILNSTWDNAKFTKSLKYSKALRNALSFTWQKSSYRKPASYIIPYIKTPVHFITRYIPCFGKPRRPLNQQHTCGWLFSCRSGVAWCWNLQGAVRDAIDGTRAIRNVSQFLQNYARMWSISFTGFWNTFK